MVGSARVLLVAAVLGFLATTACEAAQPDYAAALTKSLLYFEAQRSGRLPPTQRVQWRANSALKDGADHGVSTSAMHACVVRTLYVFGS